MCGRFAQYADPETLADHFGLAQRHRDTPPEELIAALVTSILDNSGYPISATRTDAGQIRIRYRLRSFSEPIL